MLAPDLRKSCAAQVTLFFRCLEVPTRHARSTYRFGHRSSMCLSSAVHRRNVVFKSMSCYLTCALIVALIR